MKKEPNPYDHWFETFLQVFLKVRNFHLLAEDPSRMAIIHLLTEKTMELHSLEQLLKARIIPFLNEDRVKNQRSFTASKYAHLIKVEPSDFSEVEEWVRIGYMTLFHKYESFLKAALPKIAAGFAGVIKDERSLNDYIRDTYGFNVVKQYRLDPTIWECNYIAVSTKHSDGFPKELNPQEIPPRFRLADPTKRLKITPQELFRDIERVRKFLSAFTTDLMFAQMLRYCVSFPRSRASDNWRSQGHFG